MFKSTLTVGCSVKLSVPYILLAFMSMAVSAEAQPGDVVINRAGVPIKLITTRQTRIFARPDKSSRSAPVNLFQYWYVLSPNPENTERRSEKLETLTYSGFYRVAASIQNTSEQGWLSEDDAIVWSHRQAVRPAGHRTGQPVTFYPSRNEALNALQTGDTAAATHREPAWSDNTRLLLPIVEAEELFIEGDRTFLYKLAFVSGESGGSKSGGPAAIETGLTKEKALSLSTLDVVFVIDTTASMANPISQVLQSVAQVVKNLTGNPQLGSRLRFGLVGYRDTIKVRGLGLRDMGYVARVFCNLTEGADHRRFLRILSRLELAKTDSEDYPEDVFAGLDRAMDAGMGWNRFAWKQIVVVGDSSAKSPAHPNPRSRVNEAGRTIQSIIEEAQEGGGMGAPFVISVVRIQDPSFTLDHVIAGRQFNQLVAGGGQYSGYVILSRGGREAEDFSVVLTKKLELGIENFQQVVVSRNKSTVPSSTLNAAEYPYPLLDLIRTLPDEAPTKAEEHRFATRFATDLDSEGNRVLVPHILVRQGQLRLFVSFVDFLQAALEEAGEPGSRDVETVVSQLQSLTLSLNFDEPLAADTSIDRIFMSILNLPIKSDLFDMNIAQLATMNTTSWEFFVRSIDASRTALRALLENSRLWFKLHSNSKDNHAFVPLSDLP